MGVGIGAIVYGSDVGASVGGGVGAIVYGSDVGASVGGGVGDWHSAGGVWHARRSSNDLSNGRGLSARFARRHDMGRRGRLLELTPPHGPQATSIGNVPGGAWAEVRDLLRIGDSLVSRNRYAINGASFDSNACAGPPPSSTAGHL